MALQGTFERVYGAIKSRVRSGEFRPGERLEPALLSESLNASVTPVRDALHRMTGERLVEAPLHEGFRVPLASEFLLRHLYAWHRDLLLLAVAKRRVDPQSDTGAEPASGSLLNRQQQAFLDLAHASGNPEHVEAVRAVLERLEPWQRMESDLLDDLEPETAAILSAVQGHDRKALRSLLIAYHRRRARIVPDLVAQLANPRG